MRGLIPNWKFHRKTQQLMVCNEFDPWLLVDVPESTHLINLLIDGLVVG